MGFKCLRSVGAERLTPGGCRVCMEHHGLAFSTELNGSVFENGVWQKEDRLCWAWNAYLYYDRVPPKGHTAIVSLMVGCLPKGIQRPTVRVDQLRTGASQGACSVRVAYDRVPPEGHAATIRYGSALTAKTECAGHRTRTPTTIGCLPRGIQRSFRLWSGASRRAYSDHAL